MRANLNEALEAVQMTYGQLTDIINSILDPVFLPINAVADRVRANIQNMSVDALREDLLTLQLHGFNISELKEKSLLKATLAEAIQKERFAEKFNLADGSAAAKDKVATLATASETVAEALYSSVANLLKTKLDSIYRLVDSMKSILMSKMQEAKIFATNFGTTNEIPATQGPVRLYE